METEASMDEKEKKATNEVDEKDVDEAVQAGEGQSGAAQGDTAEKTASEETAAKKHYTGEYGNFVETEDEPVSSVYSFSYKDHPESATRSGDYYANDNAKYQSSANGNDTEQTDGSNAQSGGTEAGWQASGRSYQEQNNSWQQAQSGSQGSANGQSDPFYSYQSGNGGNGGNGNNGSTANGAGPQEPGRQHKPMGKLTWKKVGICALCAVVFGVVAAVCFQGVCLFSSHVLGVNLTAANTHIASTTDNVKYIQPASESAIGTADVSAIARNTMPSIVAITCTQQGQDYYDLFGQYYQGDDTSSAGSGFIVGKNDTELLIATNNHVIEGAKTISVQFYDNEVYEAEQKGTDASADLAVVAVKLTSIKESTLKAIRIAALGDSSEAKVGEMVVAIGNALGYGQSVTVGYISAKDREITESSESGQDTGNGQKMRVLQTDAAINPGNSGGALLNMQGEVIGINSAKIAASSVEGVGYAIPISEATPIIDELMNKEVLKDNEKGYLGITGKSVTEEAASFNMPTGVYVAEVAKDGAAGKAGIKQGDIITAINGIQVTTIESLKEKANSYRKGTKVTITLKRNSDGEYKEQKVDVTLQGASSLNSLSDGSSASPAPTQNSQGGNGQDNGDSQNNGDSQDGQNDGNSDSYDGFGSFPFNFGN